MLTANNFYKLTTATSIVNSGTGGNSLSKPAGVQVASIVPGEKHSVFIPSAATFTTNFNTDINGYTIFMYAKPQVGEVLSVAGNTVTYTGHSYVMQNLVEDRVEIPARTNRARFIVFTVSDMEAGLYIDGLWDSIDAETVDFSGPVEVTVLAAGGIVDHIGAVRGVIKTSDIVQMTKEYTEFLTLPPETMLMNDDERDEVSTWLLADSLTVDPGVTQEIVIPAIECLAFKVEYSQIGEGMVSVNDELAWSGMLVMGDPGSIIATSDTGMVLENIVLTEYDSENMGSVGPAVVTSQGSSGTPAPTHVQDDSSGSGGTTTIVIDDAAQTISGWFYASDGTPLPDVTVESGVLTGAGLYVNGAPHTSGEEVSGWYFLAKTGAQTGEYIIDVPVHSLTVSEDLYTPAQIDDLYESFFGNPTVSAQDESISLSEQDMFLISTEWDIVSSG